MRPIMVAAGWAFLMLTVTLVASDIAHDAAYIFTRRKMIHIRMLLISLFVLLAFIFIIISFQV